MRRGRFGELRRDCVAEISKVSDFSRTANSVTFAPPSLSIVDNAPRTRYVSATTPIDSLVGSRPPTKAVSVFVWEHRLITSRNVDGFNLYYQALKDTPFLWFS